MEQSKTVWTRFREHMNTMAHAASVGRAYDNGRITAAQARILMTGSVESDEPRVVSIDLAPMRARELNATG